MSWTTLRSTIKTKLDTLTGSGQVLGMVDDKFHNQITAWPVCMFEPSADPSGFFTNTENMHIYTFEMVVMQEMESAGTGRDEAIRILAGAVDAIVSAFDNYQTLGGACEYTEPVTGEWFTVTTGSGMAMCSRITLKCHKLTSVT